MADYNLIIIGGGLSGLAAGIRCARFGESVLILEKHYIPGGLNSYYSRKGFLLETGLHAMTNFAPAANKHAPLNRLFRQLKLSRKKFTTREQFSSLIHFPGKQLEFSNDFGLLANEIGAKFPASIKSFIKLTELIDQYDPFTPQPWKSTRKTLAEHIHDPLLINMLLLPLMVYGNSEEHDMDFAQFVIMFRAVYREGFFRPRGTIKDFLNMLVEQYQKQGGEIRFKAGVESLSFKGNKVTAVKLAGGEEITCDKCISTMGAPATEALYHQKPARPHPPGRMSFVESIFVLPEKIKKTIKSDYTIIFYSADDDFDYCQPQLPLEPNWGVICFPENFQDMPDNDNFQIRITNSANYHLWKDAKENYPSLKEKWVARARQTAGEIIGNFTENIVYEDSFTPITIERFTAKDHGAVYGSPRKIKDGRTPYDNLFIAGTDQGYLGIVGAMLSGVTMVNHHIL